MICAHVQRVDLLHRASLCSLLWREPYRKSIMNYLSIYRLRVLSLISAALLVSLQSLGQDAQKTVRIQVEKNDNGAVESIDTTFNIETEDDINELLKTLGLDSEFDLGDGDEDIEIIINKQKAFDEGQLRIELRELQSELEDQINAINEEMQRHVMVLKSTREESDDAFLGVYYDGGMTEEGVWVAEVTGVISGTGAEAAGMLEGDQITAINGREFNEEYDIHDALDEFKPGDVVEVSFLREGTAVEATATLGTPNYDNEFHWIGDDNEFELHWDESDIEGEPFFMPHEAFEGMNMEPKAFLGVYLDYTEGDEGVRISGTVEGSTAQDMNLEEGDIIVGMNGMSIEDVEDLHEALDAAVVGELVDVEYIREGTRQNAVAELGSSGNSWKILEDKFEGMELKESIGHIMGDLEDLIQEEIIINGEVLSEELLEDLEQLRGLEDLNIFFNEHEFEDMEGRVVNRVAIFITMDNISDSEIESINENAEVPIEKENSLTIEGIYFAPNPSDGQFELHFELVESGQTDLRIYDINGRLVFEENLQGDPGSYVQMVDISDEPGGTYFLQVVQNGKSFSKKIAIQ